MEFIVGVERLMRVHGNARVTADSADEAWEKTATHIVLNKLKMVDVEWDDPEYVDWSFATTGDVDAVYVEHG